MELKDGNTTTDMCFCQRKPPCSVVCAELSQQLLVCRAEVNGSQYSQWLNGKHNNWINFTFGQKLTQPTPKGKSTWQSTIALNLEVVFLILSVKAARCELDVNRTKSSAISRETLKCFGAQR